MRTQPFPTLILGLALGLGAAACEEQIRGTGDVEDELQDLQEARENAPEVVKDLSQRLEQAKAEVVRLETELALARQGVTPEVREERRELAEALAERQRDLRQEIGQRRDEAQRYNQLSEQARRALEETQGASVEARVETDTQVVPREGRIDIEREETTIPLETTRVPGVDVGEEAEEDAERAQERLRPVDPVDPDQR